VRFVEHHFVESYYPTIENQFSQPITHNGVEYTTEIVDTAGQDEFTIMSQKHFIGVHGYMLVYSIASKASFDMLPIIRDKILNALGADAAPMVLVGNKTDLNMTRQVSYEQGAQLAASFKCPFVETSAKSDANVQKAFEALIGEIEHTSDTDKDSKCIIC
jgi:Ras homolog enriched in brain